MLDGLRAHPVAPDPFLKVGRRTLFEPEVLTAWIREQTVSPRERIR
jgi:hypothetical protein